VREFGHDVGELDQEKRPGKLPGRR